MNVYSPEEFKEIDAFTLRKNNLDEWELMERAAVECVLDLLRDFSVPQRTVVWVGPGNNGGDGLANSFTGSSVTYAGGGGSGNNTGSGALPGGTGGGGAGSGDTSTDSVDGSANTGGGGGGGFNLASQEAGQGGSGIVVLRYDTTTL